MCIRDRFYLEVLSDWTRIMQIATYLDNTVWTRYYNWTVWSSWIFWKATWTNTWDQTNITWNAWTATALQTARTINWVSFNWTANISVPSNITPWTAWNVLTSNWTTWESQPPTWWGWGITDIFYAYDATIINPLPLTPTKIIFDTELIDTWNNYDITTGLYTIPTDWQYYFNVNINVQNVLDGDDIRTLLYVNGTTLKWFWDTISPKAVTVKLTSNNSLILSLTAWDTVEVRVGNAVVSRWNTLWSIYDTYFQWYKIA